jgi:hypothetical protein
MRLSPASRLTPSRNTTHEYPPSSPDSPPHFSEGCRHLAGAALAGSDEPLLPVARERRCDDRRGNAAPRHLLLLRSGHQRPRLHACRHRPELHHDAHPPAARSPAPRFHGDFRPEAHALRRARRRSHLPYRHEHAQRRRQAPRLLRSGARPRGRRRHALPLASAEHPTRHGLRRQSGSNAVLEPRRHAHPRRESSPPALRSNVPP